MNGIKSEDRPTYDAATPAGDVARENAIIAEALDILNRRINSGPIMSSPAAVRDYLQCEFAHDEAERFCVLFLDNQHRLISFDTLFHGTIDGASVHPREVAKHALRHNAAAVILAHNHPSGVNTPSAADLRVTGRIKDALALLDIRVLDHLIVGTAVTSLAEAGHI